MEAANSSLLAASPDQSLGHWGSAVQQAELSPVTHALTARSPGACEPSNILVAGISATFQPCIWCRDQERGPVAFAAHHVNSPTQLLEA